MTLLDILSQLDNTAKRIGCHQPYIVGGAARDKVIGTIGTNLSDVDVTTGYSDVSILAKEFGIVLSKQMNISTKEALDGHVSIYTPSIKIDFSSNFKVPGIQYTLKRLHVPSINPLTEELWSRDFTCNTLLMTLDFKNVKDLTKQAIPDIRNRIIRTCLDPETTFRYNTNRIIRVIYLSCKLNFDVAPEIIRWVRHHPKFILQCEQSYLTKNIEKAMKLNPDKTIELIDRMQLWNYIPFTPSLQPYASHMLQT